MIDRRTCTAAWAIVWLALSGCVTDFSTGDPEPDAGFYCGNGIVDYGEACDGDNFASQTCQTEGFTGGELQCTAGCELLVIGCTGGCGNGVVEHAEACDDATANSDTRPDACRTDCSAAGCGDGVLDSGELCDGTDLGGETCAGLGLQGGTLACQPDCAAFDSAGCDLSLCGNGVLDPGEVCDGSDFGGVDCLSLGYVGGELSCLFDCQQLVENQCHRADGSPCMSDAQCESGLCLDEAAHGFPGGLCTQSCGTGSTDCGTDLTCARSMDGVDYCAPTCSTTADCDPGYACFAMGTILGPTPHCAPHCEVDADCPSGAACNLWTGLCGDPVVGAENGGPCLNGDPCRGNFCDYNYPLGYCVSFCDVNTGLCPGDNHCMAVTSAWADLGLCMDGCLVPGDCTRPGYTCQPNPDGPGDICLPE